MNNTIPSCVLLFIAITAAVQTSRQIKQRNGAQPCVFDYERGEVPDCVYTARDGSRSIARHYLKDLTYQSNGLATVRGANGWMYVNRRGKVIIDGVPIFDNGPDQFHNGLVRFVEEHKYGFADQRGNVVIPARYNGALPFDKGRAKVCLGCVQKCADDACEHHIVSDGEWLFINTHGVALK
ncbi:MAG: hypothetical protein JWQ87_620 [Candidatus Sulfotelmatobacter sp.]|nr:hypothetical protein [Candidatus Sulfotelmatobacter sp.]